MIEEHARVVAIEGEHAVLQTERQSSCGSCAVKSGCGTSVLASVVGQKITQLKVPNRLQAKPGDEVVIGLAENALVTGSLLVYLLPLLGLLLGGLGGELLAARLGLDGELAPLLFAVAGFALALLAARIILKTTHMGLSMQPVMLRIV